MDLPDGARVGINWSNSLFKWKYLKRIIWLKPARRTSSFMALWGDKAGSWKTSEAKLKNQEFVAGYTKSRDSQAGQWALG